jgi:hypothetical protein
MAFRGDLRAAKKEAGICVLPTCGNRALYPYEHCGKHVHTPVAKWVASKEAEKKQGRDQAASG